MSEPVHEPYSPRVRDLFRRTPGAGTLQGEGVRSGRAGGRVEGAEVAIWLRLDGERIADARFQACACPHTVAFAATVVERIRGLAAAEVTLDVHSVAHELEVPAAKLGRLLLVEDALASALGRAAPLT